MRFLFVISSLVPKNTVGLHWNPGWFRRRKSAKSEQSHVEPGNVPWGGKECKGRSDWMLRWQKHVLPNTGSTLALKRKRTYEWMDAMCIRRVLINVWANNEAARITPMGETDHIWQSGCSHAIHPHMLILRLVKSGLCVCVAEAISLGGEITIYDATWKKDSNTVCFKFKYMNTAFLTSS